MNGAILILILVIVVATILLIWLSIDTIKQNQQFLNQSPTIPNSTACTRPSSQLIDVSDLQCCCQNGFPKNSRYVSQLDAVVGPTPVYYLSACSGFCQNGSYNSSTQTCDSGSSDQFKSCIKLTEPVDCDGTAMPVAVNGLQPYYIQSAGQEACPTMGNCAPGTNTCSINTNSVVMEQFS